MKSKKSEGDRALFPYVQENFSLSCKREPRFLLHNLIGHHLSEILSKELFESRWKKLNEVITTGKAIRFEDMRGDRYFDNYVHPIKDQKGKVIQLAVLGIDITEYKNVTHQLEQSQLQFKTILDYAPALISIKDLDGNIILANKNFAILDLPEIENVIGKNIFDIFPEKIAQQIWNNNLFVLKTGNSLEFEEIFTHKDGTNHIYLTINFPVFKENNLPFGVCAISTDITERKQTEQALILDQTRQELLLTLYGQQNSSEITISQFALQYVVNLTQSTLGFLYFPKSDHNQQFFYYSPKNKGEIINYDQIDNLIIFHESLEKKYHFFKNKLNFLMEISENNSYLLTRYLTVPLLENEELVAIVCVANKENDYDEGDISQLSLFLQGMYSILQRKKAEISLKKLNLELENRVNERTKELLVINNILERRHQDLELLSELGDIIQMCQNVEEAYQAIAICCKKLFPELSGEISIFNPQKQLMEIVSSWGKITSNPVFKIDDCWALRGGKYHWYDENNINLKCNHFQDQNPTACICLPMIAQGQLLGLMSLSSMNKSAEFNKSTLQIALTVIDSIKLGIANLKLRETLSKQAILDPLTKLYNRRYMDEILNRELSQIEETYKNSPDILNNLKNSMAVMMIDLDYFKKFNDTYGHDAGDFILKNIADLLKRTIRQNDTACRYGGEEFLVILPECSLEIAKQRAENIRQKIENLSLKFQDQLLEKITVSIGIAVFPEHANNRDLMIHSADLALYEAKHQGRNRVCIAQ